MWVPDQKNELFRPYLVVSAPSAGVSNVCEGKNVLLLLQNREHVCEMCSFDHSCDKMDQAFPLRFCIPQVVKKTWERGYVQTIP